MAIDWDRYTDDDCNRCKGRGTVLVTLTPEQDFALAKSGNVIPTRECPRCGGTTFEPKEDASNVTTSVKER